METRPLAGTGERVSAVGFDAAAAVGGPASPATVSAHAALVRTAFQRGIRLFDTTFAPDPVAGAQLIRGELGTAAAAARFVLGATVEEITRGPRSLSAADEPTGGAEEGERLAIIVPTALLVKDPQESEWEGGGLARALGSLVATGVAASWGVAWSHGRSAETGVDQAVREGARIVSFPAHLLDPHPLAAVAARVHGEDVSLLIRDPHARGRLDGQFLREGWTSYGHEPSPLQLPEFRREFEPVTRLGFLTAGRERTLTQAAIAFALAEPTVASVLVPFRSVAVLDESVAPGALTPLAAEDLERLAGLSALGRE